MAKKDHDDRLKSGSDSWNEWRSRTDAVPDLALAFLHEADLSGTDLRGADLRGANLSRADLRGANLSSATLSGADLRGALLSSANLNRADLGAADLSGVTLRGADLRGANLSSANFNETDFSNARFGQTILGDLDLSQAVGLEATRHDFPSTIGIDTIYRSGGMIPELFLRGAGVPGIFFDHFASLVIKPLQYYDCFISHSSKDERFADRLLSNLRKNGIRTWYFPRDARAGEPLWRKIDRGIKNSDRLVLICSEHSLTSEPILRELERALMLEDQRYKKILFLVRIDNYVLEGWEHERKIDVTSRVIADFRGWKNDPKTYEVALERLLRELNTDE